MNKQIKSQKSRLLKPRLCAFKKLDPKLQARKSGLFVQKSAAFSKLSLVQAIFGHGEPRPVSSDPWRLALVHRAFWPIFPKRSLKAGKSPIGIAAEKRRKRRQVVPGIVAPHDRSEGNTVDLHHHPEKRRPFLVEAGDMLPATEKSGRSASVR